MKNLKTIIATLVLFLTITSNFAQDKDSVYLIKETDEMSGKTYLYGNRAFIVSNSSVTKGIRVSTYLRDDFSFGFVTVKMVGIGTCNENNELIILFESGEKIIKKSWNKFNCKGDAYFNMDKKEVELLKTKQISKIRVTNGRTYDSYTGDVKDKDKNYFIKLLSDLENKVFKDK